MTGIEFLAVCERIAYALLTGAFFVSTYRIATGPTIPDRILALDMIATVSIGFIAAFAVGGGYSIYLDIAIALGLVGFLSTVALARFVLVRGSPDEFAAAEIDPTATAGNEGSDG